MQQTVDEDDRPLLGCPKCGRSLWMIAVIKDWLVTRCQACDLEVRVRPLFGGW